MHMISTDFETRLSHDDFLNSVIMSISLGTVIHWGRFVSGACFNPAVGLFLNLVALFNSGQGDELKYVWIYLIFPFVGSILSVLFHEFIFKKALLAVGGGAGAKRGTPLLEDED